MVVAANSSTVQTSDKELQDRYDAVDAIAALNRNWAVMGIDDEAMLLEDDDPEVFVDDLEYFDDSDDFPFEFED